ncbi:MAG: hypothetical protein ACFE0J_05760 [Elainellaceae cyanobacterium]
MQSLFLYRQYWLNVPPQTSLTERLHDVRDRLADLKDHALSVFAQTKQQSIEVVSETLDRTQTALQTSPSPDSPPSPESEPLPSSDAVENVRRVWDTVQDQTAALSHRVLDAGDRTLDTVTARTAQAQRMLTDTTHQIQDNARDVANQTRSDLIETKDQVVQTLSDTSNQVAQTLSDTSNQVVQTLSDTSNQVAQTLSDTSNQVVQTLSEVSDQAGDRLEGLGEQAQSAVSRTIEQVDQFNHQMAESVQTSLDIPQHWLQTHPGLAWMIHHPILAGVLIFITVFLTWGLVRAIGRRAGTLWFAAVDAPYTLGGRLIRRSSPLDAMRTQQSALFSSKKAYEAAAQRLSPHSHQELMQRLNRLEAIAQEQSKLLQQIATILDSTPNS